MLLVATTQRRDALGQLRQHGARRGGRARLDVRGQPEDGLGGGVRAVDDQPGRCALAVDEEVLAVAVEYLTVDRVDGEVEPLLQEGREGGVFSGLVRNYANKDKASDDTALD